MDKSTEVLDEIEQALKAGELQTAQTLCDQVISIDSSMQE